MAMTAPHPMMHTDMPVPLAGSRKLPVLNTVLAAFQDIALHRQAAIRMSSAWAALFAVVAIAAFAMLVGAQATLAASPWITLAVVYIPPIVFILSLFSVAVGWHRLVLLGEQPRQGYLRVDGQVWRYIGALIAMGFAMWLVVLAVAIPAIPAVYFLVGTEPAQWTATSWILAALIGIAAYVALILAGSRIAIALPARAIGRRMKFREALAATKGNSWRILGGSLLIAVPSVVLHAIMNLLLDFQVRMPGGDLNWVGILSFLALMAVALAAFIALTLVSTSFLSRAYRFFAELTDSSPLAV
jgi:hypothetical protein